MPLRLPRLLLAILVLGALAAACDGDTRAAPDATATGAPSATASGAVPVVIAVRAVCRIAGDTPGAQAAQIRGVDGSQSAVSGGTSYWFFGDTVRAGPDGRQDVIPATVATTADTDGADCLDLTFKTTAGEAVPMFPRLTETTAWPDGVLTLDDGSIVFYMVKAYRQSPFQWHVGEVGLGRIPPGSVEGERTVETIWNEASGFGSRVVGARSPVRVGDTVYVYLRTDDGRNLVARAPVDRLGEAAAYEYYDGARWTADPSRARPLWNEDAGGFPADNGVQVTFDDGTGKWLALYNAGLAAVRVRVADEPWGPWSEPAAWFDCEPLAGARYPFCYTGELHIQLDADDGARRYMTISSQEPYDVTLLELHMAAPVHLWRTADGAARYAFTLPGEEWSDGGIAFYASERAAPGLAAVYETEADGAFNYSLTPEGGREPAFYAYPTEDGGPVALRGIDTPMGGGEPSFWAPCAPVNISLCGR